MNYQEVEVAGLDGAIQKHIVIDMGDGNYKSFPADESNPEYISFLASQKEEK